MLDGLIDFFMILRTEGFKLTNNLFSKIFITVRRIMFNLKNRILNYPLNIIII